MRVKGFEEDLPERVDLSHLRGALLHDVRTSAPLAHMLLQHALCP